MEQILNQTLNNMYNEFNVIQPEFYHAFVIYFCMTDPHVVRSLNEIISDPTPMTIRYVLLNFRHDYGFNNYVDLLKRIRKEQQLGNLYYCLFVFVCCHEFIIREFAQDELFQKFVHHICQRQMQIIMLLMQCFLY